MTEREWLQQRRPEWMTDDQFECWVFFSALFRGEHHIPGKVKDFGRGICMNAKSWGCNFATFDFDNLTRAVFLAHDMCIRFEIEPSGPGMLKLIAHKRHTREGDVMRRHPTIEVALANWREKHTAQVPDAARLPGTNGSGVGDAALPCDMCNGTKEGFAGPCKQCCADFYDEEGEA